MHFHMNFQVKRNGTELPLNMRNMIQCVIEIIKLPLKVTAFVVWCFFENR